VLQIHLRSFRPQELAGACLVLCLCHGAVRAQPAYGVPSAERAGRPASSMSSTIGAWRQLIETSRDLPDQDKLAVVNRFFNRTLTFADDEAVWGMQDHWATPMEFMARGRGDCEDFAIAKYVTLRMLGLSPHSLRLMYVHANTGARKPIAHMVLGFYPQAGEEPQVLDNTIDSVRPLSARPDLALVYSFNTRGLWIAGEQASAANPASRMSRWRGVLQRMLGDGTLAMGSPSQLEDLTAQASSR
jgi:predicted transglutaminase-like cysteine proteinase